MKPELKLLFEDLENGGFSGNQSWTYTAHYDLIHNYPRNHQRVRISIVRNAYTAQSHARAFIFSDTEKKWNFLVEIPFTTDLKCYNVSYTDKEADIELFKTDAAALLERVQKLV